MKRTTLAASIALLTAAVAPAHAEELTWNLVISPQGEGTYWLPELTVTLDSEPRAFGPADETATFNLGAPLAPWQTVYATGYNAGGRDGLTTRVPLGNGCILRFKGGILIAVNGGTFLQPCLLP